MKNRFIYLFILFAGCIFGCRKPYTPPAIASPGSYLVVAGNINSGSDSTIITLSKTVKLSNTTTSNPVTVATVTVEGNQNTTYPLQETTDGTYVCPGLNLDNSHQYRLSIKTNNEQYYSAFVSVLNSPPIDSVYYTVTNNGVNIYSSTHDPNNIVKYYRWDYGETWMFESADMSHYVSNGDTVLQRNFQVLSNDIDTCYHGDTSSNIILNSTAKLSNAVITNNPITTVASNSQKIYSEYSILVRQYALSADAYTFWTNLKTNSEQLGSIFDAQPSQINGNIHSVTNPSEPVIGYISVGSTTSKRIFITNRQLPSSWPMYLSRLGPAQFYPECDVGMNCLYAYYTPFGQGPYNQVNEYINYDSPAFSGNYNLLIPLQIIANGSGPVLGYSAAPPSCVDCTLSGTNIHPPYWKGY